jgi:hypothetical protein
MTNLKLWCGKNGFAPEGNLNERTCKLRRSVRFSPGKAPMMGMSCQTKRARRAPLNIRLAFFPTFPLSAVSFTKSLAHASPSLNVGSRIRSPSSAWPLAPSPSLPLASFHPKMPSIVAQRTQIPVGHSIPTELPHAISVSLPTWSDVVAYEEAEPWIVELMQTGYPRFFIHRSIQRVSP